LTSRANQRRAACPAGVCQGSTGRLAHPWVYRLGECAFDLFSVADARACAADKWAFLVGDSCNQHSVQNFFADILNVTSNTTRELGRTFDAAAARARVTGVWFGGQDETEDGIGLALAEKPGADLLATHFSRFLSDADGRAPDVFIVNSGLHDGLLVHMADRYDARARAGHHHGAAADFAAAVDASLPVWHSLAHTGARNTSLRAAAAARALPPPLYVWRHPVAPAGPGRSQLFSNPQKMEVFAQIVAAKLVADRESAWHFLDALDMSFPWQYDLNASDGGHYGVADGRPLAKLVDVMMLHVLLNGLCGRRGPPAP